MRTRLADMRARTLRSSLISRIMWDDDTQALSIWFRDRGRYIYEGVPQAVYDALGHAVSAGRFFNENIKGRFPCHPDPARRRHRPIG